MAKRRKTEAPVVDSLATVTERWPGREDEVARLFRLLRDEELAPGSLFVHGPSGGGKSGIVKDVLAALAVPHAIVDCVGCSTPRALYESALNQLHGHRLSASNGYANWATCEREAAFAAALRDVLAARGVCLVLENAEQLAEREHALDAARPPSMCRDHRIVPLFVAEARWHDFHLSSLRQRRPRLRQLLEAQLVALRRDAPAALALGGGGKRRRPPQQRRRRRRWRRRRGGGRGRLPRLRAWSMLCRLCATCRAPLSVPRALPHLCRADRQGRVAAGDVSRLMAARNPVAQLPKVPRDGALSTVPTTPSRSSTRRSAAHLRQVRRRRLPRLALPAAAWLFCPRVGGRPPKRPAPADGPRVRSGVAIYRAMQPRRGYSKAGAYVQPALQSSGWLQRAAAEEHLDGARFAATLADVADGKILRLSVYLK